MKKLFFFVATLCCTATLVAEDYPLQFGDVQVDDTNCSDLVAALNLAGTFSPEDGSVASYDPVTQTLHLKDFQLQTANAFNIEISDDLTIDIKGDCQIDASSGSGHIVCDSEIPEGKTLTITGGGSLVYSTGIINVALSLKKMELVVDDVNFWVIGKNYYSVEARTITLNNVKPILPNPYAINTEYGAHIVVKEGKDILSTENRQVRYINCTPIGDTIKVVNATPAYTMYYVVTDDSEGSRTVAIAPQNATEPYYSVYPSGDVVVPDSVTDEFGKTYAVRSMKANAFSNCPSISSLTFETEGYISLPNASVIANTPLDTLDISKLQPDGGYFLKTVKDNQIKWFKGKNNWFAGIDGVYCYTFYYYHSDKRLNFGAIGGARTTDIHLPDDIAYLVLESDAWSSANYELDIYAPSKLVHTVAVDQSPVTSNVKHLYVPCQVVDVYNEKSFGSVELVSELGVSYAITYSATNGTLVADTTACEEVTVEAVAASGYKFSQWSDGDLTNPRVFALTSDTVISASFVVDVPSALEQVVLDNVEVRDSRIYCAGDFRIYDLLGRDVTLLNGNLNGIYIVCVGNKSRKIAVR